MSAADAAKRLGAPIMVCFECGNVFRSTDFDGFNWRSRISYCTHAAWRFCHRDLIGRPTYWLTPLFCSNTCITKCQLVTDPERFRVLSTGIWYGRLE